MSPEEPTLIPCQDADLTAVLRWFDDAKGVLAWGGPDLTFPLEINQFKQESRYGKNHSFVLKRSSELLAFGQFYRRLNRCHLGRLVVAPACRGQGFGEVLLEQLWQRGRTQLAASEASLFVLTHNQPAMRLYRRLGFVETPYPKAIPLPDCIYMIRREKPE